MKRLQFWFAALLVASALLAPEIACATDKAEVAKAIKAPPIVIGPPDKPIKSRGQQVEEYDRAIAPYIAQARASYPAAKKRFLAGLPPNHRFSVWIRLYQNDKKSKEFRHEDVFVAVESIKNGIVTGRINNKVQLVTNHHEDERISFPESEVNNWLILRPDGTEEGNVVGKFLDHYKPR